MTHEERQLLLKDLCARLPYGVKIQTRIVGNTSFSDNRLSGELLDDFIKKEWGEIKPYLRPMSSMTKEEKKEYKSFVTEFEYDDYWHPGKYADYTSVEYSYELVDLFNSHHIDYRGLIPMGLALPAKEGMYK